MSNQQLIQQAAHLATQGSYEEAIPLFERAGGVKGAYGLAGCFYKLGEYSLCLEWIEYCLSLDPGHGPSRKLLGRLPHSMKLGSMRRSENALSEAR